MNEKRVEGDTGKEMSSQPECQRIMSELQRLAAARGDENEIVHFRYPKSSFGDCIVRPLACHSSGSELVGGLEDRFVTTIDSSRKSRDDFAECQEYFLRLDTAVSQAPEGGIIGSKLEGAQLRECLLEPLASPENFSCQRGSSRTGLSRLQFISLIGVGVAAISYFIPGVNKFLCPSRQPTKRQPKRKLSTAKNPAESSVCSINNLCSMLYQTVSAFYSSETDIGVAPTVRHTRGRSSTGGPTLHDVGPKRARGKLAS